MLQCIKDEEGVVDCLVGRLVCHDVGWVGVMTRDRVALVQMSGDEVDGGDNETERVVGKVRWEM